MELTKELVRVQADGLVVVDSTLGPFLFLLLPGEVRELTSTEDILIATPSHEAIVSDSPPVKIFSVLDKQQQKINPDSIEFVTAYKIHRRPRISGLQCPTHKDTQFCKNIRRASKAK